MATAAPAPMALTHQNVARQPNIWPTAVPPGTPSMLARASPVNMRPMALARRSGATRLAATTAPTPKNVPWHSAATTRAIISTV